MPGRYSTGHGSTWQEAVNEKGAVKNVLISGGIVLLAGMGFVVIGLKVLPRFKSRSLSWEKVRKIFVYVCLSSMLIGAVTNSPIIVFPPFFLLLVLVVAEGFKVPLNDTTSYSFKTAASQQTGYLVYNGYELNFTDAELEKSLIKHLPYFTTLDKLQQQKFLKRLDKFIQRKTFVIHDESGFKEMPILISASAIQLSFGLKKYLLPIFREIHIYPDEFVNYHQSLRIVIGNVSNNRINISWKHFLDGFKLPDGVNVGLHEMAHAYHYQNFAALDDMDEHFIEGYKAFEERSRTALLYELSSLSSLYTLYGLSNEQEFWAESVEMFFEKPAELLALDKSLYHIISSILNQGIV